MSGGSAAVSAEIEPEAGAARRPPVPPMNSSVPPGRTLPTASRATLHRDQMCSSMSWRTSSKSISARGA